MFTADDDLISNDYQNDEYILPSDTKSDIAAKQWFRKDLERIRKGIQHSNVIKRDLKYFRKLHNALKTEGDLQHEIRLLEALRNKLLQNQKRRRKRKKRFLNIPNQSSSNLNLLRDVDTTFSPYVRWCGSHNANMSRFNFVSSHNGALLHFHSDYSMSGMGFSMVWNAIDISGCPMQTLTASEGSFLSPNYPHFLLNNLDCTFVIQATLGKRVWLEFHDFETLDDSLVDIDLGDGKFTPFQMHQQLNDGIFVSVSTKIVVRIRTGKSPKGRGFKAAYKTSKF